MTLALAVLGNIVASNVAGMSVARGQERWLGTLEPTVAFPIGSPQNEWFGPGFSLGAGLYRTVHPKVALGLRLRGGFLLDGSPPSNIALRDPGLASFFSGKLMLRIRPLGSNDSAERGTGLFLELGAGPGITGSKLRAMIEYGAGYLFAVGRYNLGPVIRLLHVIQPDRPPSSADALIMMIGAEFVFGDGREELAGDEVETPDVETDDDWDDDGISNAVDACPREAEDADGFGDEDGCPDWDNDGDGIPDATDACPNDPEDMDDWEDEDGCPDADNDDDGFLDADDQCPDDAEVINGNEDDDGCPDDGLIRFVDDRIVIESNVLFDFERARIKTAARPILAAVAALIQQRPEWVMLRVEGHADARGVEDFNQRLSERRARNVMEALISVGVAPARLDSRGYGSTRVRTGGSSEDAHRQNRRVEIVVVLRRQDTEAGGESE